MSPMSKCVNNPFQYCLRLGYGSVNLLLEFFLGSQDADFDKVLFKVLESINPKVDAIEDLWMNDAILLQVSSDVGKFTISKDVWGFVFIMADENQHCIMRIDEVLGNSELFEKREVNYAEYKIQ